MELGSQGKHHERTNIQLNAADRKKLESVIANRNSGTLRAFSNAKVEPGMMLGLFCASWNAAGRLLGPGAILAHPNREIAIVDVHDRASHREPWPSSFRLRADYHDKASYLHKVGTRYFAFSSIPIQKQSTKSKLWRIGAIEP